MLQDIVPLQLIEDISCLMIYLDMRLFACIKLLKRKHYLSRSSSIAVLKLLPTYFVLLRLILSFIVPGDGSSSDF